MVCLFIEGAPARPCQWDHWDGDATGWTHWPRAPPRPLRNAARLATYKLWFPSYNNNDPVLCWQWPEQRHALFHATLLRPVVLGAIDVAAGMPGAWAYLNMTTGAVETQEGVLPAAASGRPRSSRAASCWGRRKRRGGRGGGCSEQARRRRRVGAFKDVEWLGRRARRVRLKVVVREGVGLLGSRQESAANGAEGGQDACFVVPALSPSIHTHTRASLGLSRVCPAAAVTRQNDSLRAHSRSPTTWPV